MKTKCAKQPLVSVIVPVYKVEAYLQICVDSILEQPYENIEVILVDDGSPDRCPMICEEYAKKDPRIRVIHQENRGLPGARNTGLRAASGEWIICVDSDDLWKSDLLESVMAVASDAVDLIAFSYMPYPEGQPLPQPSPLRTGTYRTGGRELLNALQLGVLDEYHRAVPYYSGACCPVLRVWYITFATQQPRLFWPGPFLFGFVAVVGYGCRIQEVFYVYSQEAGHFPKLVNVRAFPFA